MHSHIKTKHIKILKCLFINPITCLKLIKQYTKIAPCNWLTVSGAAENEKGRSLQKFMWSVCSIQLKSYARYLQHHTATLLYKCLTIYKVSESTVNPSFLLQWAEVVPLEWVEIQFHLSHSWGCSSGPSLQSLSCLSSSHCSHPCF